ncbi:MAG TPA: protein phosphatase 2C domain-containing protein [Candidatus Blautia avistercoris]|uniref:PP2C family protein-serine/threonine phosphatase n=1 Tax=Blautia sp. An249 TaxID=1965603 RepID=UPI000B380785|nr:protein phosphatase 2C domain-containing protein [Blautia sp. An249]OUO79930.1 hypothetical protein B5F53_05595 [Blautia sp. An249]HIY20252.1 protein phosphatase 2C domain-containing protein [Candidatus Blautia avistercoris]
MITYSSINEKGKRPYQEDSVGIYFHEEMGVFAVADGLGGHGKGEIASGETVRFVLEHYRNDCEPGEYFQTAFLKGNQNLVELQDLMDMPRGVKTTLTICLIQDKIYGAYIGDTRLYLFEDGKMAFRSTDHSVPQMLALGGEIKESEIRKHPDRNKLLRVLGDRKREIKYDTTEVWEKKKGVSLLLCTDGFWEYVKEKDMEKTLAHSRSPQEWLNKMKRMVLRRGFLDKQDNFSAIGIWIR